MLPDLPKIKKQKEADFGLLFRSWWNKNPKDATYELKQTEIDSLQFSAVEESQIAWAKAVKSKRGALIRVQGISGEPDYVGCRNKPAYIVIKYPDFWCLIHASTFECERIISKRKSLTADRAREIAEKVIETKKANRINIKNER